MWSLSSPVNWDMVIDPGADVLRQHELLALKQIFPPFFFSFPVNTCGLFFPPVSQEPTIC